MAGKKDRLLFSFDDDDIAVIMDDVESLSKEPSFIMGDESQNPSAPPDGAPLTQDPPWVSNTLSPVGSEQENIILAINLEENETLMNIPGLPDDVVATPTPTYTNDIETQNHESVVKTNGEEDTLSTQSLTSSAALTTRADKPILSTQTQAQAQAATPLIPLEEPSVQILKMEDTSGTDPLGEELTAQIAASDRPSRDDPTISRLKAAINVLETEAISEKDPARKAKLHHDAGAIYEDLLDNYREAANKYHAALRSSPNFKPSIKASRRLYTRTNQFAMVASSLETESANTTHPGESAILHWQRAVALSKVNKSSSELRQALNAALEADPSFGPAFREINSSLSTKGDMKSVVEVLQEAAQSTTDPCYRAGLLAEAGLLLEVSLRQPDQAVKAYGEAVACDATHLAAIEGLVRLHSRGKRWYQLVNALLLQADSCGTGPAAAGALEYASRVYLYNLGDERSFERTLQKALDADHHYLPALEMAIGRATENAEWERLEQLLLWRSEAALDARERAEILSRLGEIQEHRLEDEDKAVATYKAALAYDPTHIPTLQALGGILHSRGDLGGLSEIYEKEAKATVDPERRAARLLMAAEAILESNGDRERAITLLKGAVDCGPGRLAAIRKLTEILEEEGKYDEAAQFLSDEADGVDDPEQKSEHLTRCAEILETKLNAPGKAIDCLQQVAELDKTSIPIRDNLIRLYRTLERWEDLADAYCNKAELCTDKRYAAAQLHAAGDILEYKLGNAKQAEAMYLASVQANPGYTPSLRSLGRAYGKAGRYAELLQLHKQELRVVTQADACATLNFKIGQIYEQQMDNPDEAVNWYSAALSHKPGDLPTLRAVERCLTSFSSSGLSSFTKQSSSQESANGIDSGDDNTSIPASSASLGNGAMAGNRGSVIGEKHVRNMEKLAEVLEEQILQVQNRAEKARLLYRLAELYEGPLARQDYALDSYTKAAQVADGLHASLPALEALARIHELAGRAPEAADALRKTIELEEDPARLILLTARLAELCLELGDTNAAVDAYKRALARDAGNLAGLLSLDGLLRRTGDTEGLAFVCEQLANAAQDPAVITAYGLEAAMLRQELGQTDLAVNDLLQILERVPGQRSAMELLEVFLSPKDHTRALINAYKKTASSILDPVERQIIATRLSHLEIRCGNLAEAEGHLQDALIENNEDLGLLVSMRILAEEEGNLHLALKRAEAEADVCRTPELAHNGLMSVADRWESNTSIAEACRVYEKALLRFPDSLLAASNFARLCAGILKDDQRLARIASQAVQQAASAQAIANLEMILAGIARRSNKLQECKEHLGRSLEAVPDQYTPLKELALVLELEQDYEEAAVNWHHAAQIANKIKRDTPEALEATVREGLILGLHLREYKEAIKALDSAVRGGSRDKEALALLCHLYQEGREYGKACQITRFQIEEEASNPEQRQLLYIQLARQCYDNGDLEGVHRACIEASNLNPSDPTPIRLLAILAHDKGDWDTAIQILEDYIHQLPVGDAHLAVQIHYDLGVLYRDKQRAGDKATAQFSRVIELDPRHGNAREALANIYASSEGTDALDRATAQHLELLAMDPLRLDSLYALLRLYERCREHDRAFVVGSILQALGALDSSDAAGVEEYRSRAPRFPRRPITADERTEFLVAEHDGGPARALLDVLGTIASKITDASPAALGANKRDRIFDDRDPLRYLCNKVSELINITGFELYRIVDGQFAVTVVPTNPTSIVVSASSFEMHPMPVRKFLLARALELCRGGASLAVSLPSDDVLALLVACVRMSNPMADNCGISESELELSREMLQKQLNKKDLRRVIEAASTVDPRQAMSLNKGVLATAEHTALLIAGDAGAAIEAYLGGPPGGRNISEIIHILRGREEVENLILYALGKEHQALRQMLSLNIGTGLH